MSREAFEKLPEISKILERSVQWSDKFKIYHVKVSGDFEALRDLSCVAGAWSVWQKQQKRIEELESKVTDLSKNLKDRELAVLVRQEKIDELETRINLLIQKWEKDAEYADQIACEDFVQNTLNDCIEELRQVIKGGDE